MIGNTDERKTGNIHRLEKILLTGPVKWLHPFRIIGKGNGVNDPVELPAAASCEIVANLLTDPDNIRLLFNIADKDRGLGKELAGIHRPLLGTNHIDNQSPFGLQGAADGTGDGFFISQSENNVFSLFNI